MSEVDVPADEDVFLAWSEFHPDETVAESSARWSAWLAAHDAEVAARALEEAAEDLSRPSRGAPYEVWAYGGGNWLKARAIELRER